MERDIIKIDEDLCNGCGECIPNCHEGALQIIDGKARLVSDLLCDGLGACIGYCPEGAITVERRVAAPYDEIHTIKGMIPKGKNTILAHLKHLIDYSENEYFKQGITYLYENRDSIPFDVESVMRELHEYRNSVQKASQNSEHQSNSPEGGLGCGCSGSIPVDLTQAVSAPVSAPQQSDISSVLGNWPVQMHLINPAASYFRKADLLLAADCVAFAAGNFHTEYLKGKTCIIACPKLDTGKEVYVDKLRKLIDEAEINTITVMMMEVPCCTGLMQLIQVARASAKRKVPVKTIIISIKGELLKEEWM